MESFRLPWKDVMKVMVLWLIGENYFYVRLNQMPITYIILVSLSTVTVHLFGM